MLNGKYLSLDFVVERLYRDSLLIQKADVSEYDFAEYVGEALLLIGAQPQYQDNFALVTIKDYRGVLPCSPVEIQAVRNADTGIGARTSTDTFANSPSNSNITPGGYIAFSSDEYVIKGNIIHVPTLQEGTIEVKYQSLLTDDRGFPMIPDEERYAKAIESYIKYKVFRKLWEIGDLRDAVYRDAEQDWLFYVNSAQTKAIMPNEDQMESLKNSFVKLVREFNTKKDTGRTIGMQEQRRTHNSM